MVQVSFAFPVHAMVSQVKNIVVLGAGRKYAELSSQEGFGGQRGHDCCRNTRNARDGEEEQRRGRDEGESDLVDDGVRRTYVSLFWIMRQL